MTSPGRKIYTSFGVALVAVIAAGAVAVFVARTARDQTAMVSHTVTVMQRLDGLRTQVAAGQDAAALTTLAQVRTLVADNPVQVARADSLQEVLNRTADQRLGAEFYRLQSAMRAEEVRLLGDRSDRVDIASGGLVLAIELGTVVGLIVVAFLTLKAVRDSRAQQEAEQA
ncbi:MAG TPA: hypothetical protein VGI97_09950, partial [Gemmatimonadaceae bacterium]